MALNYPGGYITKSPPTPTANAAPGIWTMDQAMQYIKAGTWPTPPIGDQYFQYTNLLLGTGSTNGAQNNTFLDSSSNNFTITRNGNTTQGSFTPFSQAAGYWSNLFDGNGDYLRTGDNAAFHITGDFTLEAWVYLTANQPQFDGGVLSYGGTSASAGWAFSITGSGAGGTLNRLVYGVNASVSGGAPLYGVNGVPLNQWTHIAATRSGTTVRLFINGQLDTSGTVTATPTTNAAYFAYVGTQAFDPGASTRSLIGYISNARIVKGQALYTAAFTPSTSPLTTTSQGATASNVSLLTCQSNRFVDNGNSSFTLTTFGNTTVVPFQPFGAPTSPYSTTNVGGSGFFDGTGDSLSTTSTSQFNFGTGDFTIEFWVYPTAAQAAYAGVVVQATDSDPSWYVQYDVNGTKLRLTSYSLNILVSATSVPINTWTHIAIVRNGSGSNNCKMYFNGVQDAQGTWTTTLGQTSALKIGAGSALVGSPTIQGYLSSLRIVNGTAVYTTGFTPPTAPLTAITNTALLTNFTNAAIFDNAAKNDMETVGNAQVSTSVTKFGNSASFDGAGDYLSGLMNANLVFGSGDMTIECWVYPNTISGIDTIFDTRTSGSFGNESFLLQLNGGVPQVWAGSYSASVPLIAGAAISTSTWTYIAFSRTAGVNKLFVNGSQVASNTNSWTQTLVTTNYYYIGQTVGIDRPFDGYISNLRITKGVGRYTYNFTSPTQAFGTIYKAEPTPAADPYFDYTTLLLPGSGTNGAQNNTFLDSSTNAFSITRNGNTTQGTFSPFSQTGWGNYFDGTGDYLSVADNAGLTLTGDFTIECWVYPDSISATDSLIGKWQVGAQEYLLWLASGVPAFYFAPFSSGTALLTSSLSVPANNWTHIAVVRSGNSFTMYVNGVSVATATNSGTFTDTAAAVEIGSLSGYGGYDYAGYISNVRLVKGTAVYTAAFTPPTTALTAITNTQLLTCQGNRFYDANTQVTAKTITVNGNPSVQAFSPFNPTAAYSAATNGGSGYFDGTGDYLTTATSASGFSFGTGDFTVEFWINSTQTGRCDPVGQDTGFSSSGWWGIIFNLSASGDMAWYENTNSRITASSTSWNNGGWNHVAVTRSGNSVRMFLNGNQVGSTYTTSFTYGASNVGVIAGVLSDDKVSGPLRGYISGLRILKGTAQYTSNFTPPTAPLTAITNTQLLLNFTNAGITDATAKNVAETNGGVQISNAQAKFGSTSIAFDGGGSPQDALIMPMTPNLQLLGSDWTIEFWIRANSWSVSDIMGTWKSGGYSWIIQINGSNVTMYNTLSTTYTFTFTFNTGQWYHVALSNYGLSLRCFVDGNQVGSAQTITAFTTSTRPLYIGYNEDNGGAGNGFNGYMQDVRITKGIARYTQNFTPPAAAFQLL